MTCCCSPSRPTLAIRNNLAIRTYSHQYLQNLAAIRVLSERRRTWGNLLIHTILLHVTYFFSSRRSSREPFWRPWWRSWGTSQKHPSNSAQKHDREGGKSAYRGITLKGNNAACYLEIEIDCLTPIPLILDRPRIMSSRWSNTSNSLDIFFHLSSSKDHCGTLFSTLTTLNFERVLVILFVKYSREFHIIYTVCFSSVY